MFDNQLICVVDDDASVRDGAARLLRSAGYFAETFSSAEAFLESGDPRRFACVITDIQMPGMSGIELAEKLGRIKPPTPVVLVTARTEEELLARAAASPAAFLLRKPYAAEHLLACLQSAMR